MWAHGWVARIASHWSFILCRDRLVTVEAPGCLRHPSSIQHDAVVNSISALWLKAQLPKFENLALLSAITEQTKEWTLVFL